MSFFDNSVKKSSNEDIRNLFNKIGADSGSYQEIQRDSALGDAQRNWPIVKAIEQVRDAAPKRRFIDDDAVRSPLFAQGAEKPVLVAVQREVVEPRIEPVSERLSHSPLFASRASSAAEKPVVPERSITPEQPVSHAHSSAPVRSSMSEQPVAPAPSLQGVLSRIAQPETAQVQNLVSEMLSKTQSAQAGAQGKDDRLSAVFSRLAEPAHPEPEARPVSGLRSMLGFMRK